MEWLDFENDIKNIFTKDNAKTVPGSGNGKGEEDVIGNSTIIQCKYTDKKNISILSKDVKRLKEAAELQNKLPLFASRSRESQLLSLLIDDDIQLEDICNFIITYMQIKKAYHDLLELDKNDKVEIRAIENYFNNVVTRNFSSINNRLSIMKKNVEDRLNSLKNDIENCNLFDKEEKI